MTYTTDMIAREAKNPVGLVSNATPGLLPSAFSASNLRLWVSGISEVVDNGNGIEQWNDMSGNNHHVSKLIQGDRPAQGGTANGQPGLIFSNSEMDIPSGVYTGLGEGDYTILTVFKPDNTGQFGENLIAGTGGSELIRLRNGDSNKLSYSVRLGTGNDLNLPFQQEANGVYMYGAIRKGTHGAALANYEMLTYNTATNQTLTAMTIGMQGLNGTLAEVIILNIAVGETELAGLLAYLNNKYAFTSIPTEVAA